MPVTVYRSAKLAIQNNTNTLWTLDSAELLFGAWAGSFDPYKHTPDIGVQSAIVLNSQSLVLHQGAEGFARFSSAECQMHIHWSRPWVGEFGIEVSLSSGDFEIEVFDQTEMPANGVAMIKVTESRSIPLSAEAA